MTLKLPKWEERDLLMLFQAIFDVLTKFSPDDPDRLKKAKTQLTSYPVKKIALYVKSHWKEYISPESIKQAVTDILVFFIASLTKAVTTG